MTGVVVAGLVVVGLVVVGVAGTGRQGQETFCHKYTFASPMEVIMTMEKSKEVSPRPLFVCITVDGHTSSYAWYFPDDSADVWGCVQWQMQVTLRTSEFHRFQDRLYRVFDSFNKMPRHDVNLSTNEWSSFLLEI